MDSREEVFNHHSPSAKRTAKTTKAKPSARPEVQGVYHKVGKGETMWRIAKTYNVPINDIITINNIPDVAQIEVNQLVLIPGVERKRKVVFETESSNKEFVWPLKGRVTKYFGNGSRGWAQAGIAIKGREGSSVKASRTGKVVFADYLNGYGYTVILDHGDGYHSVYARNADLLVKLNEMVFKNGEIARLGTKDKLAYLHFEIRKNAKADNPLHYLPKSK